MSTLKEKAEQILQEKNEKIIPENFSNNLAIFDVSGALNEFPFTNADDLYGQITINEGTDEDTSGNSYRSIQLMGRDIRNYDKYIVDNNGGNDVVINMHSTSLAQSVGLTAEKIKKDEVILGITGTYVGSGSNDVYSLGTNVVEDYDEETGDTTYSMSYDWLEKNGVQVSKYQIEVDNLNPPGFELISSGTFDGGKDVVFECVVEYSNETNGWEAYSFIAYNNSDNIYDAYFIDNSTQKIIDYADSFRILPHTGYDTIGNSIKTFIGNTTDNLTPGIMVVKAV